MTTLTKSQMAEVIVQVRRAVISRYNMAMNVRRQLEEADNG